MFKLVSLALVALAAVSAVNAAAVFPRKSPPAGWIAKILEPYDDYHTRYLAIGCRNKHNTQFFDDCCHPMKKGETLEKNRKPYCRPGADPAPSSTPATVSRPPINTLVVKPTSTSSPAPQPTSVPDEGDDCEDDDDDDYDDDDDDDEDCEEEPASSPAPVPTSSSNTPKPTPTPTPSPVKPSSVKPSSTNGPKPSTTPVDNSPSESHTGGYATWYTQNGNYGACGNKHSDNDFIAALDYRTYGDLGTKSSYCGKKIRVSWQGKSVDVIMADACPTCRNAASIDLSVAAFKALAPLDVGELTGVSWELL